MMTRPQYQLVMAAIRGLARIDRAGAHVGGVRVHYRTVQACRALDWLTHDERSGKLAATAAGVLACRERQKAQEEEAKGRPRGTPRHDGMAFGDL